MTTVQTIFTKFENDYKQVYNMSKDEDKAFNHIVKCRTESCGFHVDICDKCGHKKILYNSCKDRNCPTCQTFKKEDWINNRKSEVINSKYFHIVFTIPKELRTIVMQNKRILYGIMFKASSETIKKLSADKKFLGACPGFLSVLHTWGQSLEFHPHIHMIVTGGGLTKEHKWRNSRKNFFIPVKVLSKVFRGKFLHYLKQAHLNDSLSFFNDNLKFENSNVFKNLLDKLYSTDWYSYAKKPFDGPHAVIEYLGRYTHRISISNNRILKIENDRVFFSYKDYRNTKNKIMSLSVVEFIRRFLLHVLPSGFVKIRYYGILANKNKNTKLILCKKLTGSFKNPLYAKLSKHELLMKVTKGKAFLCPNCGNDSLKRRGQWALSDST
jgi:hypothetical protein